MPIVRKGRQAIVPPLAVLASERSSSGGHSRSGTSRPVPHESWDLPDPRSLPIDRLREMRDRLRERVWRLVARQGWYKLQPARMLRFNAEQSQHA